MIMVLNQILLLTYLLILSSAWQK